MKKKLIIVTALLITLCLCFTGCSEPTPNASQRDINITKENAQNLASSQSTPTDIEYSLERYNLIRRAYWVNGMRERANNLPCEIEKPLGYIVLFSGNAVVGRFVVDGKVSSLNSFLTPSVEEKQIYGHDAVIATELADVDGSYGENDNGIFFFTPDGKYVEWSGDYLYSDIPFTVDTPVVQYEVK